MVYDLASVYVFNDRLTSHTVACKACKSELDLKLFYDNPYLWYIQYTL